MCLIFDISDKKIKEGLDLECTPSVIMSLTGGDGMTIAEVSKKYDITSDTLRYYERIGLIPPVPRTKSGIRDYDENSCAWIELMKCMRQRGCSDRSID